MVEDPFKEWLDKANEDFEAAIDISRRKKKPLPDVVCFHSQQSAEKYLKAYLTQKRIRFPKIHDLVALKNLCLKTDTTFELLHSDVVVLGRYAVTFRYPGEEATKHQAKTALACAKNIRDFIREKI